MSNPTMEMDKEEEATHDEEEDYSEDFEASRSEQLTSAFSEDELVSRDDDKHQGQDPSSEGQHSHGVPDELKGLTHYFDGGDDENDDVSVSVSQSQSQLESCSQSQDDSNKSNSKASRSKGSRGEGKSEESSSIENILEKLNRLTMAQLAMESVLDAESGGNEDVLLDALEKARRTIPEFNSAVSGSGKADENVVDVEESSLSFKAEMEALQKLTQGTKKNYNEEQDNDDFEEDSEFQRIMKQYDDLDKTTNRSAGHIDDMKYEDQEHKSGREANVVPPRLNTDQRAKISPSPFMAQSSSSVPFRPPSSNSGPIQASMAGGDSMSSSSSLTMTDGLGSYPGAQLRPQEGHNNNERYQAATFQEIQESHYNKRRTAKNGNSRTEIEFETQKMPPKSPLKSFRNAVKESASVPGFGSERPITPSSPIPRSSRSIASPRRKMNHHVRSSGPLGGRGEGLKLEEENLNKIQKLEEEIVRQESLLNAFQQDNQKLYNELKTNEKEHFNKEAEWEEITNSLKTEVATLKINRLIPMANSPSRPGSAQKAELDRLREEATLKSQQVIELRKEIILMRNKMAETTKPIGSKQGRAALIREERERESQKTIRSLTKQVRTLQKILYRKDPSAALALAKATSRDDLNMSQDRLNTAGSDRNDAHVSILEARIIELEKDLEQADDDAKNRLKDFQAKLNGLKGRYEDQLKDYERKLDDAAGKIDSLENNASQAKIQEFKDRSDKSQAEVSHLKQEINRYKRELEIAQKSSISTAVSQATVKQDAGTLSLAIKTFKSELSDKEKEIIRMKKEIADLNRTTTTLKREREKYLNLANALSIPGSVPSHPRIVQRTRPDVLQPGLKPTKEKDIGVLKSRSPTRSTANASLATSQMLQSALEYERTEFEQMLDHKKKELIERDQIIVKLKRELEELRDRKTDEVDDSSRSYMLNELRSRVTTQNELIHKLKDHIANYRRIEGEYLLLKQENGQMEIKIKELKQKVAISQTLNKPESEVLELLSNKFDELNSRYLSREGQMLSLLNRLTVQTGSNFLSPRLGLSSGGNLELDMSRSELDLRQLSPTLSMHLLNANSTEVQEV